MPEPFHSPPTTVNAKTRRAFHDGLCSWFGAHRRDLPWRQTRDPYAIWVSEIMLQQTRVETVIPYYRRWLAAFPTVTDLARANPQRVLKLWEGLGYYSRARNLHRAAQQLLAEFGPEANNPRHLLARLRDLPGIGPYTAGAIGSIAFDLRVPLVDGNVARVFARVFGLADSIKLPATQKRLWTLAESLLPTHGCGEFNQALMELGALVCVPGLPDCAACPLAKVCVAHATGRQSELPNRGPRAPLRQLTQDVAWVRRAGQVLVRRRPATGLLADLWELPATTGSGTPLLEITHTITNRRICLRVFAATAAEGQWVRTATLRQLPMPAAHRRAVTELLAGTIRGLVRA